MAKKLIAPVHPDAYLKELLEELAVSQYRLAKDIGGPAMRINYVVNADFLHIIEFLTVPIPLKTY
ncbi:MAG: hypothetical protein WCW53_06105 [Syntrophales bacterium]